MGLNTVASNLISKTFDNTLVSGLTLSQSATWIKRTAGTYTPLTGAMSSQTETNVTVNAIEMEYSTSEILESGGQVRNMDRRILVKPVTDVDIEDANGDSITIGSRTYNILSISRSMLGSTELVWDCQCR
tara:strand:+ start:3659 stop:4048 length:390 start_codon:yes stop_codon:yes gene_type:complete